MARKWMETARMQRNSEWLITSIAWLVSRKNVNYWRRLKNSAGRESQNSCRHLNRSDGVRASQKFFSREKIIQTTRREEYTDSVWVLSPLFSTQENNVSGFECFRGRQKSIHCSKNGKLLARMHRLVGFWIFSNGIPDSKNIKNWQN